MGPFHSEAVGYGRIDLYYQHRVDRATPIEETVGGAPGVAALQTEYSLWTRDPEQTLLPAAHTLDRLTPAIGARHDEENMATIDR